MKKPVIWMPMFIGDYHSETSHLTTRQHGAYLLLLMAAWMAGGSLVDDDARFAAITHLGADQWAEDRTALAELFTMADGTWSHARLIEELSFAAENKQKKSSAGSKGAAKRWQNDSPSPSPSPSSEAKASGANPDADLASLVFNQGLNWLHRASGKPDGTCRSLLGKWRKSLGSDEALLSILGRAQREGVIEPVGWIEKAILAHQAAREPSHSRDFN
jgi:uncharacterized protein YdaU (DUF1376 family)